MGQLQPFQDLSGQMSKGEELDQNLSQIIDELNRQSDQLDSVGNTLKIISYGSTSYVWNGTGDPAGGVNFKNIIPVTTPVAFNILVFMSRSSVPNNFYNMPYTEIIENGNGDTVTSKSFFSVTSQAQQNFFVSGFFYANGSAETFTFYYFLFQQPTGASS